MDAQDRASLIGREFLHFKGNRYRLEAFAKDSETLEDMVVYRALYMHPRVSVGFPDEQARSFRVAKIARGCASMDSGCARRRCSSRL